MKNNIEQFLQEYKQLEAYVQASEYQTILAMEQSLTDADMQDKLKLCRITRNYIVHHPDGKAFAAVSDDMIAFLQHFSMSLVADKLRAEDQTTTLAPVRLTDTLSGAAKKLLKCGNAWIPVTASKMAYVGILDTNIVLDLIKQGINVDTPLAEIKKFPAEAAAEASAVQISILDRNDPITEMKATPALVLDKKKNKYIGVIM